MQTFNPAYAGTRDAFNVLLMSRNQWVSLPDAPVSQAILMHTPINGTNTGLGLSVLHDEIGPIKQTGAYFDYAYRLSFSNQRILSLGLKGGVNFYDAQLSDLETNDPNDPVFASDINRNFLPNLGVGAFFYTNKYYLGLSIPKLIENKINKNAVATENVSKEEINVFFMAGYVFELDQIVKFKPSILTRYIVNSPISIDLGGTFVIFDKLSLGAIYRVGESFGALCQVELTNQLKIGYSYDFPINQLGAYNKGTHEIMISYDFNIRPDKVRSPRYF